jgi:hypothetical protein
MLRPPVLHSLWRSTVSIADVTAPPMARKRELPRRWFERNEEGGMKSGSMEIGPTQAGALGVAEVMCIAHLD